MRPFLIADLLFDSEAHKFIKHLISLRQVQQVSLTTARFSVQERACLLDQARRHGFIKDLEGGFTFRSIKPQMVETLPGFS